MEQFSIDARVAQYIKLRDKIKEMDDAHKEKMKPFRECLEDLNKILLGHLNTIDAQNVSTEAGTVYRTEKKSCSIADASMFWNYVESNQLWDLIDRKANVTAVKEFIDTKKMPPPGVNYSTHWEVGVRRK